MSRKFYKHYSEVPVAAFKKRWPNFAPAELASKSEGELAFWEEDLDKLQALRNELGKPLLITSAYRSPAHNRKVGGATNSAHMAPDKPGWRGMAFDIRQENQEPYAFIEAAKRHGFVGFGQYPKSGFIHIDTVQPRTWNDGANFPKPTANPTKGFADTEVKTVETPKDTLLKPEVIGTLAPVLPALIGAANGTGPMPYVLSGIAAVAFIVGLVLFIRGRAKAAPRD